MGVLCGLCPKNTPNLPPQPSDSRGILIGRQAWIIAAAEGPVNLFMQIYICINSIIPPMRPTTRSRILDYLSKQQTSSAGELSRALGMTGANMRHHLAMLESDGVIELIGKRREARGRPVNIYALSRRLLGDGLGNLAVAAFAVWLRDTPEAFRETGLRSLAQQLAGVGFSGPPVPMPRRLARTVDRLNDLHYRARWEAGAEGPRLILGYCPYVAILADLPELCCMDAFLLEQCIGQPVEQTAMLQPNLNGFPFCTFQLKGQ